MRQPTSCRGEHTADSSRIWDTLQKCFGQAAVVKAPSVLLSARQKVASTSSSSAWRPLLGDYDVMLPSPKRLRSEARRWGISGVQRPPLAQGSGSAIFNSAAAVSRYAYSPTPCMCFPAQDTGRIRRVHHVGQDDCFPKMSRQTVSSFALQISLDQS